MSSDLGLALRLIRGAGRRDLLRFLAMVVGVGFAVFALLIGLAAPRVSASARSIEAARSPQLSTAAPGKPQPPLHLVTSDETMGDEPWTHVMASGTSADAPRPPGVAAWPAVGHSIVSPALAKVLAVHPGLRAGLGVVDPTPISNSGLTGPAELFSYSVVKAPAQVQAEPGITRFGGDGSAGEPGSPIRTLLIETFLLVVLPALVFLTVCLRMSAASRSARSFALGLVGMSPTRSAQVYAREMGVTAAAGGASALVAYAALQGRIGAAGVLGVRWWPEQAAVSWWIGMICLWITVAAVMRLARRTMIKTASRSRSTFAARSRKVPVLGALAALPALGLLVEVDVRGWLTPGKGWATGGYSALVTSSIAVALIGIVVAVPAAISWLGAHLAERTGRGLRLGLRGASAAQSSMGKLVAFVAVVVMVGGLCAAFLASLQRTSFGDPAAARVSFDLSSIPSSDRSRLGDLPSYPYTIDTAVAVPQGSLAVQIGDCAGVRRAAAVVFGKAGPCVDGIQRGHGGIGAENVHSISVHGVEIAVPPAPTTPRVTWDLKFPVHEAAWARNLDSGTVTYWVSRKDESYSTILTALHRQFPTLEVDAGLKDPSRYAVFRQQQGIIHAGLFLGLALSIGSFILTSVESRWSRTRSVMALAALGVPTRVLRTSNAVQFAFPVLVGGLCAAVVGTLGGWAFLSFYGTAGMFAPAVIRWCLIALVASVSAAAAVGWITGAGRFRRDALADL